MSLIGEVLPQYVRGILVDLLLVVSDVIGGGPRHWTEHETRYGKNPSDVAAASIDVGMIAARLADACMYAVALHRYGRATGLTIDEQRCVALEAAALVEEGALP